MRPQVPSKAPLALWVSLVVAGPISLWGCRSEADPPRLRLPVEAQTSETATELACHTPSAWRHVAPVFDSWCVGCHATERVGADRHGAPEGLDFDRWSSASASADAVVEAIGPGGTMPPLGGISEEERERVRQWVACGAEGSDPLPPDCDSPVFLEEDVFLLFEGDGAALCARGNAIDGNVFVLGLGVESASCLCEVTGDILVAGPTMQELSFPLLHHVGGRFELEGMENLVTVELPRLEAIDGALLVEGQPMLERIGLEALREVGGVMRVSNNPVLQAVEGPVLETVGSALRVLENTELSAVRLAALREVEGTLEVVGGPRLTEVDLSQLESVTRHLLLTDLPVLDALSLSSLAEVGEDLVMERLSVLHTLEAMPALETVGGEISISQNVGMAVIEGFATLRTVGAIRWVDNPYLEHIGALPALEIIAEDLSIERAGRVEALPALGALTEVGGRIEIAGIPSLIEFDMPPALTRLEGALVVRELRSLETLRGPGRLEEVGGALILARLPMLRSVRGFEVGATGGLHLVQVGVVDLDVFENLRSVDGSLVVRFDAALADVTGLHGVRSVTQDLRLGTNASLSRDDAESLVLAIGRDNVGGEIILQGEVW